MLAFAGVRHCRPFCQGFSVKRRKCDQNCLSPEPRKTLAIISPQEQEAFAVAQLAADFFHVAQGGDFPFQVGGLDTQAGRQLLRGNAAGLFERIQDALLDWAELHPAALLDGHGLGTVHGPGVAGFRRRQGIKASASTGSSAKDGIGGPAGRWNRP